MPSRLSRRSLTWILSGAAVVLLIVAALIWWNLVWQSPSRVFWGMLASNLQTSSVTKHQQQKGGGQSMTQDARLQLGSTNAADWLVAIKQSGSDVTTESIGTPTTGYIRYVHASTDQKHANGEAYDFSKVLNVWGKADAADKNSSTLTQLFSQTVLDLGTAPLPPIGNLSPDNSQNIMQFMQDQSIFTPDYKTMKREKQAGRRVYIYTVSVKLEPYVRMMQAFARDSGLHSLDSINPSQYQSAAPVSLVFTVDSQAHQLRQVSYRAANFTESYSDYGLVLPIQVPTHTIPVSELQTRLQKL